MQATSVHNFSIQQLEEVLVERRLQEENEKLDDSSTVVNVVTVTSNDCNSVMAVGPSAYLPVIVGGVPVDALVDTGIDHSKNEERGSW